MEDELILLEEDRTKLDGIVSQMESNNESEEDILFVVKDFKSKYGTEPVKKKDKPQQDVGVIELDTKELQQDGLGDSTEPTADPTKDATDVIDTAGIFDFQDPSKPQQGNTFTEELKLALQQGLTETGAGLSGVPNYMAKGLIAGAVSKEDLESINALPQEQREVLISAIFSGTPQGQIVGLSAEKQEELTNKAEDIRQQMNQYNTNIVEDLFSLDAERTFQGMKRTVTSAVQSLPSMAVAFIPAVGLLAVGAGTASQKQEHLERQGEGVNMYTFANALVSGVAEGFFERFTKKIFAPLKGLLKGNTILAKKTAKQTIGAIAKDMGIEGGSEMATEIVNKLADKVISGQDVDFGQAVKDVADAGIIGGFVGGVVTGGRKGAEAAKNYAVIRSMDGVEKATLKKSRQRIIELNNVRTPETSDIIDEQIIKVQNNFKEFRNKRAKQIKGLSKESRKEMVDISKKVDDIEKVLKEDLSPEAKEGLNTEIKNLEAKKLDIINTPKETITTMNKFLKDKYGDDFKESQITKDEFSKLEELKLKKEKDAIQKDKKERDDKKVKEQDVQKEEIQEVTAAEDLDPNSEGRQIIIPNPRDKTKPIKINVPTSIDGIIDNTIQKIVDKFHPIRKLQAEITKKKGKIPRRADFDEAETALQGKASNDLDIFTKKVEGLAKDMAKKDVDIEQLSNYMYAKHAEERNKHIKGVDPDNSQGSGMTDKQAQKILEDLSPGQTKKLEGLTKELYNYIEDTRQIMEKYGLETNENVTTLRHFYENYVPLQGFASDEIQGTEYLDLGQSLSIKGKETKLAKGRSTKADNVVSNIITQHTNAIIRARKNEVTQTIHELVKDNPEIGDIFSEDKPDMVRQLVKGKLVKRPAAMELSDRYVGVKIDGKKHFIKFHNERLAKVLNSANVEKTTVIAKTLGRFSRILSSLLTSYNPEFIVSNFARDIQTAMYNQLAEADISENTLKGKNFINNTIKSVLPSMGTILKNERHLETTNPEINKYYEEFKADGAKTGWFYAKSSEEIQEDITNIIALQNADKISVNRAKRGFKSLVSFVENVNSSVENAVRLAAYMEARKVGVTRSDAASYAKNLTVNFNRSGEWGTLANSFYLFFNASMQGTARFAKSMLTLKKTTTADGDTEYGLNRAQKLAGAVTAFSSVLTVLNQAMSGDDDDGESYYSKIPDYVKERNMVVMNPVNGKDYLKIPLPYGYNIFNNMGVMTAEVASGDREIGDATGFMINSMLGSFSPISFSQSKDLDKGIMKAVVPTIMKPFLELSINEDHFGSTIFNENLPFGTPKPESTLSRRMTPMAFKNISKFMNEATGGSDYVSGGVDVNPDKLYHVFKFAGGGVGKFIGRTASTVEAVVSKAKGIPTDLEARKIPFAGRLYGEPSKFQDTSDYFDRRVEVGQLYEEYKNSSKEDRRKDKYDGITRLNSLIKSSDKQLKGFRKRRDRYSDIEDPIERATKLNELEKKTNAVIDKFNKEYNKYRK